MKTKKIQVRFINNLANWNTTKKYNFLTILEDLHEGDLVVVETRNGHAIAEFITYVDEMDVKAERIAFSKVDVKSLHDYVDRLAKIKLLKNKIKMEVEELTGKIQLEILAEMSPRLKTLIDTLHSLESEFD
ncbi:hypothetical protein [Listeria farberi]|uniref:Uncharacterized protein n=1 Tax=Listeria farberi TaxID=2713500 RepID=A0A7X0ZJY6_9LIST|nr:hypothetical protein [Listeria farberi]MBC2288571.1 hypothetical protein [Listeria farberi]